MRCLPGVKVEAGVVAGVVVRGPGRQADPVGIAVLIDAAGVVTAGEQFAQDCRLAGAGQAGDVEQSHRLRVPAYCRGLPKRSAPVVYGTSFRGDGPGGSRNLPSSSWSGWANRLITGRRVGLGHGEPLAEEALRRPRSLFRLCSADGPARTMYQIGRRDLRTNRGVPSARRARSHLIFIVSH